MKRVWPDAFVEEGNLSQNIHVLRRTLGETVDEHRHIVTVPGRGYRFVAEVREISQRDCIDRVVEWPFPDRARMNTWSNQSLRLGNGSSFDFQFVLRKTPAQDHGPPAART